MVGETERLTRLINDVPRDMLAFVDGGMVRHAHEQAFIGELDLGCVAKAERGELALDLERAERAKLPFHQFTRGGQWRRRRWSDPRRLTRPCKQR